jgi:hypothetical protein
MAESIINERIELDQVPVYTSNQITFKELSRLLKVNSNIAKQMLFDYSRKHKIKSNQLMYYLEIERENGIQIQLVKGTDYSSNDCLM